MSKLPDWLAKELDNMGVFVQDAPREKQKPAKKEPSGWMPSYLGEEPPF